MVNTTSRNIEVSRPSDEGVDRIKICESDMAYQGTMYDDSRTWLMKMCARIIVVWGWTKWEKVGREEDFCILKVILRGKVRFGCCVAK